MSPRTLRHLARAYVAALFLSCTLVYAWARLHAFDRALTVTSIWSHGELVRRATDGETIAPAGPGETLVNEIGVGHARIFTFAEIPYSLSLVAGLDGVQATLGGKIAYVTPDDLLARQGYDRGVTLPALSLSFGADVPLIEALLADRLGTTVPDVRDHATIERVRFRREVPSRKPSEVTPDTVTPALARAAAVDAARFLARGINMDGRFRYMVDAPTNKTLAGYDWPRHSGATYFLAQAGAAAHEGHLQLAAKMGASYLRNHATLSCGDARCIGEGDRVDVGSSALALLALVEVERTGLDATFRPLIEDLARFLRSQQRPDGEFMHEYDRVANRPNDVQYLYYSGEATLALARAHALDHDPANLDAARRGLANLVGRAWSFFGDRYYFGEEHWTCQAVDELWDRAPDAKALDFCERWQAYGRAMMFGPDETPWGQDADGSYGVTAVVTPRFTPAASRAEAGAATLEALTRANASPEKRAALAAQLRRSMALLIRNQLRPGPSHLFADPTAVYGAIPGSPVDWQLRIDYAQHAGSAFLKWADVTQTVDTTSGQTSASP